MGYKGPPSGNGYGESNGHVIDDVTQSRDLASIKIIMQVLTINRRGQGQVKKIENSYVVYLLAVTCLCITVV